MPFEYPGKKLTIEERKKRLYHYTSFNSFVRIWLTKTLKFGKVTGMNDLFENNFSSQCNNPSEFSYLDYYHEERKKYKQISLTMDYDSFTQGCMSPMMWGIYGDKDNGVCIEFDYSELVKKLPSPVFFHDAVRYTSKFPESPKIDENAIKDLDKFLKKNQKRIFFTKHNSWAKENEYRIVSKENLLDIRGTITAIYVTKWNSVESQCIEELLRNDDNVSYRVVRKNPMLNVGTYIDIVDFAQFKDNQKNYQEMLPHIKMLEIPKSLDK